MLVVLQIGSLVAGALAMYLFVSHVIGTRGGAGLAGLAWGVGSFRVAHLRLPDLLALCLLPLAFLCLHRVIAARRKRDALVLGLLAGLQGIVSADYAAIGGLGLVIAAVVLGVTSSRRGAGRVLARLALAGVAAAIVVLPFRHAAFVDVVPDGVLFPGAALILLALAGAGLGWRVDARPLVASMAIVALAGFLLWMGAADPRVSALITFALATLAALGWRELSDAGHRIGRAPHWVAPIALAAVALESLVSSALPPRQ